MDFTEQNREYREEVKAIAQEIVDRVKSGELSPDDVNDALHESVDGDQWVIYTYRAKLVVAFLSDNGDAAYDEGMEVDHSDGINWSAMAYFAMCADVRSELPDDLDELVPTDEED